MIPPSLLVGNCQVRSEINGIFQLTYLSILSFLSFGLFLRKLLLPLLSFGCLLPSGFVILIEGKTLLRTHVHSKQPFVTIASKDTPRNIISDL